MSTDLHHRTRQPDPDGRPDKPEPPKSSLSVAQVVGGALAAMTAAALGSRLSLAGTVLGAAIASVVAAVAGAAYTASLRRTSQGVSTVLARVRPTSPAGAPSPTQSAPAVTTKAPADTGVTPASTAPARRARVGWKQVLIGALLMFVVAALALTGLELATGRALSGGNGTTVGQVAEPGTRASSAATERPTAEPSATPSTTVDAEPGATASAAPSSEPTAAPSTAESVTPTPSPTPTPASTPTLSASPSGATPAA